MDAIADTIADAIADAIAHRRGLVPKVAEQYLWRIYGLNVQTNVDLSASQAGEGTPDFSYHVLQESCLEAAEAHPPAPCLLEFRDPHRHFRVTREADAYRCEHPGMCTVLISEHLTCVTAWAPTQAGVRFAELLLVAFIPSLLLVLRGEHALHASAVAFDEGAVAIAGPSGSGKSTLAALACAAGATMVSDDCLRVLASDGGVRCVGGPQEFRLRANAEAIASLPLLRRSRLTPDARQAATTHHRDFASKPLQALVFPEVVEAGAPGASRLDPIQSVSRILGAQRTLGLEARELLTTQLRSATALARDVPAWSVTVPRMDTFNLEAAQNVRELLETLAKR